VYTESGIIYLENNLDFDKLNSDLNTDWSKTQICPNIDIITDWAYSCEFNEDLSHWDFSNIEVIDGFLYDLPKYTYPVNNWDLSNVKYITCFIGNIPEFNMDINGLDISSALEIDYFLYNLDTFNSPLDELKFNDEANLSVVITVLSNFDSTLCDVSNVRSAIEVFDNIKKHNIN